MHRYTSKRDIAQHFTMEPQQPSCHCIVTLCQIALYSSADTASVVVAVVAAGSCESSTALGRLECPSMEGGAMMRLGCGALMKG